MVGMNVVRLLLRFLLSSLLLAQQQHTRTRIASSQTVKISSDIDDLRESPALKITKDLASLSNFRVLVVEPNISKLPPSIEEDVTLVSIPDAIKRADICVLLVDHSEFKAVSSDYFLV